LRCDYAIDGSRRPEPFDSDEFLYELKIDGFRALAYVQDGKGELISRNGQVFRGFAELATWIAEHLKCEDAVICELDLEGIVAKRKDSLYQPEARKPVWFKIKNRNYNQVEGREEFFK
jgi:ATP-dependent DNA ligase